VVRVLPGVPPSPVIFNGFCFAKRIDN